MGNRSVSGNLKSEWILASQKEQALQADATAWVEVLILDSTGHGIK